MHIHILGICGTFMGGVAMLARQLGFKVTGSDSGVYPPMSTQLEQQGIELIEGFESDQVELKPDLFVIGNAMKRGIPVIEEILNQGLAYVSGPQFISDYILKDRWVLAVAGTHGKTTTSSILAWILEFANLKPGFLIGGIPENFGVSARLGDAPFFVMEADEYDTAFFDKRSKFVHYRPRTVILNNLEFDHADIFDSLADIQRQFHHLVRIVPGNGLIINAAEDKNLDAVLDQGCWTKCETFSAKPTEAWSYKLISPDGSKFEVYFGAKCMGVVEWPLIGLHNVSNALAAIAAARHAGVGVEHSVAALKEFVNVKRRMEIRGVVNGVTVYDDFAHHPTAIDSTLDGLRNRVGNEKIVAILEPRSNTMRMGVHKEALAKVFDKADEIVFYHPAGLNWNLDPVVKSLGSKIRVFSDVQEIVNAVTSQSSSGDHLLVMSNGGFDNIHQRLLDALALNVSS